MAACLYDPAFASLYQIAPDRYRRAVTGLTLFGGFASTVFWPLAHVLATVVGMARGAVHVRIAQSARVRADPSSSLARLRIGAEQVRAGEPARQRRYLKDRRFLWLAASFAAATFVFSALSAFMIAALGARGFTVDEAVWIAALIGPMQVTARVIEWMFAGRLSAIAVGVAACTLALLGMVLLNVIPYAMPFGVLFAVCYGASNGILTIARGTVPAELFGPQQQGALLGALARPSFATKALAPALFAAGLSAGFSMRTGLALLALISAAAFVFFALATRPQAAVSSRPLANE